ncbi:MAG: helix-turn-helix domain-containing protein [Alphaproteobacteria bacterium]|nr:helix-turn-helix domain-containing protein [Alphaproteobacteria bacterium]
MSSYDYAELIETLLREGRFASYGEIASALRLSEESLKASLADFGRNLPDLCKFQLLAWGGTGSLEEAIRIVEQDGGMEGVPSKHLDPSTGSIRWVDALDSLKDSVGFSEDRELAEYLGIPPSTLSDFRRGKAEVNPRIKLRILDHLGFHRLASGIEFLLKDEMAAASKRLRLRQARKIANKRRVDEL